MTYRFKSASDRDRSEKSVKEDELISFIPSGLGPFHRLEEQPTKKGKSKKTYILLFQGAQGNQFGPFWALADSIEPVTG